jgi:hypothetical protein
MASARSSGTRRELIYVARADILPNPWNVNKMNAFMYAKALESIQEYGFVVPLVLRPHPTQTGRYELVDGEHRFRAGCDLSYAEFPALVDDWDEVTAQKLGLVLNELHGQPDPQGLGDLLNEILNATSMDDLLVGLPYTEDILKGLTGLSGLTLPGPTSTAPVSAPVSTNEPWVERTYKMPKTVALVIDEAIEKAKDGEPIDAWQALERVAADFLGNP